MVEARPLDAMTEAALEADSRAGAAAVLEAVRRRRFANRSEGQRLRKLFAMRTRSGRPACSSWRAWMKQA